MVVAELLFVFQLSLFTVSHGQATIQIEGAGGMTRPVMESAGTTEVCVTLTNASPEDSAEFSIQTISSTNTADLYFEHLNVIRTLNFTLTRTCVNVTIVQNGIETGNTPATFSVALFNRMVSGALGPDDINNVMTLSIAIQDTDEVVVGLDRASYQVQEGFMLSVCVDLVSGQILDQVSVAPTIAFTPVVAGGISGSMTFVLTNSTRQRCLNFQAGATSTLIEGNRFQTATLMPGDIAVQFSRRSSPVEIIDPNVATLAVAGMTSVEVLEGDFSTTSVVTVCVDLLSVEGGLGRDIVINVTTVDGTATGTMAKKDYFPVMMTLTIPSGTTVASFMSSEHCVNVTIMGDNVRELNETFVVRFDASPDQFQGPDNVTVTIVNDGDVSDCTMLLDPANGNVDLNGTTLGSVAQYTCNDNFLIVPMNATLRTCGSDNWDGVEPTCVAICEQLRLANGAVLVPTEISFITEGTRAQHSCIEDFRLDGNEFRTCQSNGLWSGSPPVCRPIMCPMLPNPERGSVVHNGFLVGSVATFSCFRDLVLDGNGAGGSRRVCSPDGTWTGSQPTCKNGAVHAIPSFAVLWVALVSMLGIIIQTCI